MWDSIDSCLFFHIVLVDVEDLGSLLMFFANHQYFEIYTKACLKPLKYNQGSKEWKSSLISSDKQENIDHLIKNSV